MASVFRYSLLLPTHLSKSDSMSWQEGLLLELCLDCLLIRVYHTFSGRVDADGCLREQQGCTHAALANETPYKALYGKDAHLGHLRAIGPRAFVHVERTLRTWSIVPGKDVLSATASTETLFESTTHRREVYVRAGTSFSSRHLQSCLSQTW